MRRLLLGSLILLAVVFISAFATSEVDADKDPCRDDQGNEICPIFDSFDDRVNKNDAYQTITAFCRTGNSLDVLEVNEGRGSFIFNVSRDQIRSSLATARSQGNNVLIQEKNGRQLWALNSGQMQLFDARPGLKYSFNFNGAVCGGFTLADLGNGAAPVIAASTATRVPGATIVVPPSARSFPTPTTNPNVRVIPSQARASVTSDNKILTGVRLNVFALPDNKASIVATVPAQALLNPLGRSENSAWIKINYGRTTGWITADLSGVSKTFVQRLTVLRR